MLCMNIILLVAFLPLCISDTPYLLRVFPTESGVIAAGNSRGPCVEPVKTLAFLQGADDASLEHEECVHDSAESILTCKLSIQNASATLDLDSYPLGEIKVLVLFVQQHPEKKVVSRVLDLCFINRFGSTLEELAICGYTPPITKTKRRSTLHILDVPALAIVSSNIQTLLISGVHLWQSVELRQFRSLKHLLIVQGDTNPMNYYHSPHCADCINAHPTVPNSFYYLLPLSSQITYYYYYSNYEYDPCTLDLLKHIRANPGTISTLIIETTRFSEDAEKPICQTCASGLCPLLAACLDETTKPPRRTKDKPFECLCVEELDVEDEFESCKPMTLHQPMYSMRCNHTPSFWNYVTRSMIILVAYILASIIVLIISTIYLSKSKS